MDLKLSQITAVANGKTSAPATPGADSPNAPDFNALLQTLQPLELDLPDKMPVVDAQPQVTSDKGQKKKLAADPADAVTLAQPDPALQIASQAAAAQAIATQSLAGATARNTPAVPVAMNQGMLPGAAQGIQGGAGRSDNLAPPAAADPATKAAGNDLTATGFDLQAAKIADGGNKLPVDKATSAATAPGAGLAAAALAQPMVETRPVVAMNGAPATLHVMHPVGEDGWGGAMGQKVIWMTTNQTHEATLQLNPPDLGPINVRLEVTNDQVAAQFTSPHAAVREAIEASLPQLRDMMAANGMSLGQASVGSDSMAGQQQFQHSQEQRQAVPEGTQTFSLAMGETAPASAQTLTIRQRGNIDTFA